MKREYIETELDKYLNKIILNQEVSNIIKSKNTIFKKTYKNYNETDISSIIERIHSLYSTENIGE
ncbi:hypothetical protein [Methanosalsum natronophilum]|uniref:hypothetical protein n=1 Tax=Methanosalsum natronophilum TaxID=768733 RepID=UPI0021699A9F|nr:hypothetical protein [Methanosalsum natronophilum]MCS3923913.1 hypothetical protein [Methanosalsum natronophilum]